MTVNQSRLSSVRGEQLLVWNWYRVGQRYTASRSLGKVFEALSQMVGQRRDGTLIAIAAPYLHHPEEAAETLQTFVDEMLAPIEQELNRVADQSR